MSLLPYTGQWTSAEAAHLLRRTLIGPKIDQINTATNDGMLATVNNLLSLPVLEEPINYSPEEQNTPLGQTWVNNPLAVNSDPTLFQQNVAARNRSLLAWSSKRFYLNADYSIAEKMTLFWQNHFGLEMSNEPRANYRFFSLLYNSCLGNFKQLVKDVTIEPAMLLFLNGNSNTLYSPNENFARELLELYTIGKGVQIGPGNYTNYTEQDVAEGAKIMTGWQILNYNSTSTQLITPYFNAFLHDTTTKTLSFAFNNATISDNAAQEFEDFIDIIFTQNECARFICRKIYRFFVNSEINSAIETNIITELANTLVANNYAILPVMQELLMSQHFYDITYRGAIIKSPIEYMAGVYKSVNASLNYDIQSNGEVLTSVYYITGGAGMNYFGPPNVGGWTAYYLAPAFSQLWINSAYIKTRFNTSDWITLYNGPSASSSGFNFENDAIGLLNTIATITNASDPNNVIQQLELLFACKPYSPSQFAGLKTLLTNGLPDFEWTIQYNDYLSNPGDPNFSDPVENRVRQVLSYIFKSSEYHIQ
ncbi:MAG: DUF1800 domain-containing protein [Lishizhenia sp.]